MIHQSLLTLLIHSSLFTLLIYYLDVIDPHYLISNFKQSSEEGVGITVRQPRDDNACKTKQEIGAGYESARMLFVFCFFLFYACFSGSFFGKETRWVFFVTDILHFELERAFVNYGIIR